MKPAYLVDGSGYIFRAYYAVPPGLTTKDGFPTNALTGFARMMHKLLRDANPKHIVVTFDTKEPTFRHLMYDQYKANRDECPADLVPQMPLFREIVRALGIQALEQPGVEADDIIATLTRKLHEYGQDVVIVSGDKDLTQLVSDSIKVYDGMRDINYDAAAVREKFGVAPDQIRDFLAITGDSSDNVPGLRGVGPKGAQKLLEHFGSLDQMLANPAAIDSIAGLRGAKSIREKVEAGLDQLELSKQLVSLKDDVEPFASIKCADDIARAEPDAMVVRELYERLEFGSLLRSLKLDEADVAQPDSSVPPIPDAHADAEAEQEPALVSEQAELDFATPDEQAEVPLSAPLAERSDIPNKTYAIVTQATFEDFVSQLAGQPIFAFDTETTSLDVRDAELLGISISWEANTGYYLATSSLVEESKAAGEVLDPALVRERLGPIFADPNIKKVGLNLKYDMQVLQEQGYTVEGTAFDAMLCAYVLNPDRREVGLKQLTLNHLGEKMQTYEELVGEHEHLGFVPVRDVAQYACHDADASWGLFEVLNRQLGEYAGTEAVNLLEPGAPPIDAASIAASPRLAFEQVEMPLVPVLAEVERNGIRIDIPFLQELEKEFGAEAESWQGVIHELAGEEFNLNSPKQLGSILFEKLGIPTAGVKKTKTGFSTDASVLDKLAAEHEIARAVLEYRELHKLNSTYVLALQRLVHPKTGRIHTSFNQAVAATGRLSSSDPNLQNIPIKNPRGRRIRRAFIAAPGCVLLSADYSQIELRILAHLSGDKNLQQAFIDGDDIHERTAREIFGGLAAGDEERDALRRTAKTINFGIIYGISAFRLSSQLGVSRKQAQEYIDGYFGRYPRVRAYYESLKRQLERSGYVSTLFGHRRFRDALNTEGRDAGYVERSMMNAPIQGTAAEVIKLAMVRLQSLFNPAASQGSRAGRRYDAKMVLQVHDELVFEVAESQADEVQALVIREMEGAVAMAVPLRVDTSVGTTWS